MESSVYSCLKGIRQAVQGMLGMADIFKEVHDVAASLEVLEYLLQEVLTPSQLHASGSGSPYLPTPETSPENEDEHRLREYGDRPREAEVARQNEDRARRLNVQQAFQAAKFAAAKGKPPRLARRKRRYSRRR